MAGTLEQRFNPVICRLIWNDEDLDGRAATRQAHSCELSLIQFESNTLIHLACGLALIITMAVSFFGILRGRPSQN